MLRCANHLYERTKMKNLCLAGGVALNCVGNGRILRESPFQKIWVQPAAGDAGGALGSALFIWHQLLGNPREASAMDSQEGTFLGPAFSENYIQRMLDGCGAHYRHYDSDDELCATAAELVANNKVVGWFQGRMEFGPRALGGRSILGDARNPEMQSMINLKIKFRESFRPFAPMVLREHASEYFELNPDEESPYMLLVAPVASGQRMAAIEPALRGLEKLKTVRSTIPAVTHVDYSARIQTVDSLRHKRLYQLLQAFNAKTGCPVMINTSFNIRGEPIVCNPEEAYRCFMATQMDALVMEGYIVLKNEQPKDNQHLLDRYLSGFAPD
jgi:carbamoyltransferase